MRTRTHLLLLLVTAMIAGALGSVVAVASTAGIAEACSVAAPTAQVSPSDNLTPGDKIEISGWGFYDLIFHDRPPRPAPAPDGEPTQDLLPVLPATCDFDMVPMRTIEVVWQGETTERLAVVNGPEFSVSVRVPANSSGPATITVGTFSLQVYVGTVIEPPPPCPLAAQPNGTAHHECPDPWPCPLAAHSTQPAPGEDVAPGFLPPCPEPCVDYAHTTDNGTVYDYQWDCPDPCGDRLANPGAPDGAPAVWCPPPPPDPCPVYLTGAPPVAEGDRLSLYCPDPCALVGGDAVWCPEPCKLVGGDAVWCPEPCPLYLHAPPVTERDVARYCPDPCGHSADLVARPCPPPEPCPIYLHGTTPADDEIPVDCPDPCALVGGDAIWCPPPPHPEPCPVFADGRQPSDRDVPIYCPDPCRLAVDDAAVWCPEPCVLVGGDAISCPEPCVLVGGDAIHCPEPCVLVGGDAIHCPEPCVLVGGDAISCPQEPNMPTRADAATASVTTAGATTSQPQVRPAVLMVAQRVLDAAQSIARLAFG